MYNQSYEEYIRNILGYPNYSYNNDSMSYMQSQGYNQDNNFNNNYSNTVNNNDLEQYYPEIYRIVYPMVSQICSNNTREITREVIDEMTDEIYSAIEGTSDNEINLSINLQNDIRTGENRTQPTKEKEVKTSSQPIKKDVTQVENRNEIREDRQIRNRTLRDLIRILIIRELLRRPGNRPPRHRQPMRPPFPGGPRKTTTRT